MTASSDPETPHFGPDGLLAWEAAPADMRQKAAILVRMIRALMDAPFNQTGRPPEDRLKDAGFSEMQIAAQAVQAWRCLSHFRSTYDYLTLNPRAAAQHYAARLARIRQETGTWAFRDIVTLTNAATIAFCLVDILASLLLMSPREVGR